MGQPSPDFAVLPSWDTLVCLLSMKKFRRQGGLRDFVDFRVSVAKQARVAEDWKGGRQANSDWQWSVTRCSGRDSRADHTMVFNRPAPSWLAECASLVAQAVPEPQQRVK